MVAEAARLRGLSSATSQALKRAAGTLARRLPVEARRDIQGEYALQAGRVTRDLSATSDVGAVVLTGKARAIGLVEFGGKWGGAKSPGASAQVFVAEGRHNYGGTFIAKGKNGARQIFDRVPAGGKRAPRLPIKTLYGPNVAQMLRKGDRPKRLDDFAQEVLTAEITRLLK